MVDQADGAARGPVVIDTSPRRSAGRRGGSRRTRGVLAACRGVLSGGMRDIENFRGHPTRLGPPSAQIHSRVQHEAGPPSWLLFDDATEEARFHRSRKALAITPSQAQSHY